MKVRVGRVEFDVLSAEEAKGLLNDAVDRMGDLLGAPVLARPEESGVTDAAGALVLPIYTPPLGMEFRLHVVNVEADGFNPAVPFNGAGAYWQLRVAGRVIDEASLVAAAAGGTAIPFTRTYGFMQGGVAVNAEPVELRINAGPVNTLIRALAQGTLVPHPDTPSAPQA